VDDSDGSLAKYAGIGIQFAVSLLLFLFVGQWLDRKLGTSPIFLMIGVFVGAGAAFYSMYRKLMADQREADARRMDSRKDDHGRGS
jgi:F0F1-type ATP synthase assembly protein I